MKCSFIKILSFLFICSIIGFAEGNRIFCQSKTNDLGKVKIIVPRDIYDHSGIDIQPFRVYLQNKDFFKEMVYLDNQQFELDVPEGIYNIVLKENVGETFPYQRANFFVSRNKKTTLRIARDEGITQVCNKNYGFVLLPTHTAIANGDYEPKYDNFLMSNSPFNVVIKYCQKQIKKDFASYTYALLTFENLTIYADKINFDEKNFIVELFRKRNISWIEVGNCQRKRDKFKLTQNSLERMKCNK